jgi:hypothetical protein
MVAVILCEHLDEKFFVVFAEIGNKFFNLAHDIILSIHICGGGCFGIGGRFGARLFLVLLATEWAE